MTYDFRASQVRTNKIIASGSTETNAALLIYPFASALNQSGSINTAVFATGSIGSDVFLYVSGAVNSMGTSTQGTTLFGGDLKVSGAFMTLNSIQSYGSVIAYSTFSAFQSASFLSDATIFGGNYVSGPFIAYSTSRLVGATTISGAITSINTASFSGPVTASNTALFSGATTFSSTLNAVSTASFAGPVTGSNTFLWTGATTFSGTMTSVNSASFSGVATFSNNLVVTGKLSGSLQTLSNGNPYLKAGPNITIVTESNGAVAISASAGTTYTMNSWLDFLRQRFATYPAEFSGDITAGVKFYTTVSGASVSGFRMAWSGSGNKTFTITVWSGSSAVATASLVVSSSSPGVFTGSFSSPPTLAPYRDYYISYRDQAGANYYVYAASTDFYHFAGYSADKSVRVLPNLVVGWFYCYAGGNAAPTSVGTDSYSSAIEPVMTFA